MEETTFERINSDVGRIVVALGHAYGNPLSAFSMHWSWNTFFPWDSGNVPLNKVWDSILSRMRKIIAEIEDGDIRDDAQIEVVYREAYSKTDRWSPHRELTNSDGARSVLRKTLSDMDENRLPRVALNGPHAQLGQLIAANMFVEARQRVLDGEYVAEDYVHALVEKFPYVNDLEVFNDMLNLLTVITCVTKQNSLAELFDEVFLSKIRKRRNIVLNVNESHKKTLQSVLASSITAVVHQDWFDVASTEKAFSDMSEILELRPVLKIARYGVQGLHDLGRMHSRPRKLHIVIDPTKDNTDVVSLGETVGAFGAYYNTESAIYLGGMRDSNFMVRGTLIHELTHFVANEVFKNNCNPYSADDEENMNRFANICDELYRRKDKIHERLSSVFKYPPNFWHCELIVRVPQLIAMAESPQEYDVVNTDCSALLQYYRDVFLPACRNHLLHLRHENNIFSSSVRLSPCSIGGNARGVVVLENGDHPAFLANRQLFFERAEQIMASSEEETSGDLAEPETKRARKDEGEISTVRFNK